MAATEEVNFGFAGAPSGSNLFMTFGDPTGTQIVVIGQDPLNQSEGGNINTKDVLNISQAGSTTSFGVNGNQINPDEGAFITYVTGANTNFLVPNLDQNEADVEANIDFQNVVNATSASFTVNQTNPGVGPVTVKITAFSTAAEPGVSFVDGLTNDKQVDIASVSVVDFVEKQVIGIYSGRYRQPRRHLYDHRPEHRRSGEVDDGWNPQPRPDRKHQQHGWRYRQQQQHLRYRRLRIHQANAAEHREVGYGRPFEDDGPAASGETESATVQEDDLSIAAGDLSDGIDEAGDPPTDVATGSVAALVTAGADEPATFSLSADTGRCRRP